MRDANKASRGFGWLPKRASEALRRLPGESLAAVILLLVAWAVAARFTPDYIVPPLVSVAGDVVEIFTTWERSENVLLTLARIGVGLVTAFVVGTALGLGMGYSKRVDRFWMPLLQIVQGVPSLSWVIISIIWFQSVELRIWFILLAVTLPGFAFQAMDSYRAIPKELREMARSLRPRRFDTFHTLTVPSVTPDLLTAWKVNLGLGTRVVLVAELVGASIGVGYQLRVAENMFNMSGVIAWTGVLVLFVLLVQHVISRIERRLLRYRPSGVAEQPDELGQAAPERMSRADV